MGMLSAQVDELRELATRYDELQAGVVRVVRVPLNMGSVLREAADTIWELRDDLQRANAENTKLRERIDAAHMSRLLTENENESLRELVRDVYRLHWNGLDCTECPWFDECDTSGGCPWLSVLVDHMRELGVEVG